MPTHREPSLSQQQPAVYKGIAIRPSAPDQAVAQRASLMQRLYIGTRTVQGAFERYAKKFNLLEVRLDLDTSLSAKTLRRWRKQVPPTFAFCVVLPNTVTALLPSKEGDRDLDQSLEIATQLESPVILIANPMSVTPTVANRKRLETLVKRIPHDVVRLAWEPPGLWQDEDSRIIAGYLGLVLVGDAARDSLAPGSVAYTRLRGLGDSRRLSAARLDKVNERLQPFREAYVVVEVDAPVSVMNALRASEAASGDAPVTRSRHVEFPILAEDEEQE